MSKADSLFDWWLKLPPSLRPNPFSYSERDDVELAQFQLTLSEKLEGLQTTIERPFMKQREALRRELREAYAHVVQWLDQAKERFGTAHFELDCFILKQKLRLTWRPILPQILEWLEGLKASVLEAGKQPLDRPFLSLLGADPECLEVPDFHPVCGFWSDNYFIGHFPWNRLKWNAVIGHGRGDEDFPSPQEVVASLPETVWFELLANLVADVRRGHKAVKDCPWTVAHALCELAKPDKGASAPDMAQASLDRGCWAMALHVPFRRWLHAEASKHSITSPLADTKCYPAWRGFAAVLGDDPTSMIGGLTGHRRACFFAFLLDELATFWRQRELDDAGDRAYAKPWHGEALALLKRNPDASAAEIARKVRKNRSTVSRDETIGKLLASRRDRPKGFTDGYGRVDGIVDPGSIKD